MQNSLDLDSLYLIAVDFRLAIMNVKSNNLFSIKDRMHRFPWGCCDDACDLLAYYLITEHKIESVQNNGVYRDNDPNNTTNHAWLFIDSKTVIDITIDQFQFGSTLPYGIYVGDENMFYHSLQDIRTNRNYNIANDTRLWHDYLLIRKHLIR